MDGAAAVDFPEKVPLERAGSVEEDRLAAKPAEAVGNMEEKARTK